MAAEIAEGESRPEAAEFRYLCQMVKWPIWSSDVVRPKHRQTATQVCCGSQRVFPAVFSHSRQPRFGRGRLDRRQRRDRIGLLRFPSVATRGTEQGRRYHYSWNELSHGYTPFERRHGVRSSMAAEGETSGTPSKTEPALGNPCQCTVWASNRSGRMIMPTLNTIGHAVNMHPTFTIQDKTATTVELLTGLRNPGGPFNSDDLDQDSSNTISIVIASIP